MIERSFVRSEDVVQMDYQAETNLSGRGMDVFLVG